MKESSYSENVTVDEGTDDYGVTTKLHFEGDQMIVQKSFDAAPILEQCRADRIATAGERWGEMRKVGTIDPVTYAKLLTIKDNKERTKFIRNYFRQNTGFVSFERYLK